MTADHPTKKEVIKRQKRLWQFQGSFTQGNTISLLLWLEICRHITRAFHCTVYTTKAQSYQMSLEGFILIKGEGVFKDTVLHKKWNGKARLFSLPSHSAREIHQSDSRSMDRETRPELESGPASHKSF